MRKDISHRLLTTEREQLILGHLRESEVATVAELCQALSVSEATVRRDLQSLQARGYLERIHGGASLKPQPRENEPIFTAKESKFTKEKQRIAARALELIQPNDIIYLDGGSTVLCLARLLEDKPPLTIVTNSLMAAAILMESKHHLVLTGGEFRAISRTLVGPLTVHVLQNLTIDKAFMGTFGLSQNSGLTTTDFNEAFTKKQIYTRARQVILLADHSKMGASSFANSGALSDINLLITDAISDQFRQRLEENGVQILLA